MIFDVTLKGFDVETSDTDDLVKWVEAESLEQVTTFLDMTGLSQYVRSIDAMDRPAINFDDGLDVRLSSARPDSAIQLAEDLWFEADAAFSPSAWIAQVRDVENRPKTAPLPAAETWLAWYEPTKCDDSDEIRLLVPHGDGHVHEHPFDLLFKSVDEAYRELAEWELVDEARESGWVLCRVTVTPKELCEPPWFNNYYRCPNCQHTWESDWDCKCEDECPQCRTDVEPYKSEDARDA